MKKSLRIQENTNKRLDKFLVQEIFFALEITRGEIIRQIKEGKILLNGEKTKPSRILKKNDLVEIDFSQEAKSLLPSAKVAFEIIFKNKDFFVINKPAGVQVHPSSLQEKNTLVSGLVQKYPEISTVGDEPKLRPGIVHRLDRDTSGVLLVARNQKTFEILKQKFKNREIKKTYWAITQGDFSQKDLSGLIEKPLARAKNYKKQTVAGKKTQTKIRTAITAYSVLKNNQNCALVEVSPKTGRMHQIRVHLFSIGHPLIGDKLYKMKKNKSAEKFSRQLLHAKKIDFDFGGKSFSFEAPLPTDFKNFLVSHLSID